MERDMHITFAGRSDTGLPWLPKPETSGSEWVNVAPDSSTDDVSRMFHELIAYNGLMEEDDLTAAGILPLMTDLMNDGELIISGGIRFTGDDEEIVPSCCCGMENWHELAAELLSGGSPWMGHDPEIYHECRPDSDVILTQFSDSEEPCRVVTYAPEEFTALLKRLDSDFTGFVAGPLRQFVSELCPDLSDSFCTAFRAHFGK